MKSRGRRHVEVSAVRAALRPATRTAARPARRSMPPSTPQPEARQPWRLGPSPSPRAAHAVASAKDVFGTEWAAMDACLGWLFARLPTLGGEGDDMVAHHARLTSERYYSQWAELCRRLQLFGRDP